MANCQRRPPTPAGRRRYCCDWMNYWWGYELVHRWMLTGHFSWKVRCACGGQGVRVLGSSKTCLGMRGDAPTFLVKDRFDCLPAPYIFLL